MAQYFYRIPDGVKSINQNTFDGYECIECVYIPRSVRTFAKNSFDKMDNLCAVLVPADYTVPRGLESAINDYTRNYAYIYKLDPDTFVDNVGVIYDKEQRKLIKTVYSCYPDNYGMEFTDYSINYGVEEICEEAFRSCHSLESIHIPNTVKEIGNYAFCECKSLKEMHIPKNVVSIGEGVFPENLERIDIPEHFLDWHFCEILSNFLSYDCVFHQLEKLKKIHIIRGNSPQSELRMPGLEFLEEIEVDEDCVRYFSIGGLLYNKEKTELVWCPEGKTKIINLPDELNRIGGDAFSYCKNLHKIQIPELVKKIGYNAFSNCTSLKKVYIPDSVEEIGDWAFDNCKKIELINIPQGLRKIGINAFDGCDGIKKVYVSHNWGKGDIMTAVLGGCINLAEILVDKHCTSYCSNDGVLFDSKMTKLVSYPTRKGEQEYRVPEGVKKLGKNAFFNSDVKRLFIPSSVTAIEYSFIGSRQLKELIVDKDNPYFSSRDGVLFNKDKTELVCYPQGRDIQEYTIPETVAIIGDFAFNNCSFLKEVSIPISVKIGTNAFEGCDCKRIPI